MNTIHSTDWLPIIEMTNDNMNKPNKLDHRCLLKRRNTRSNYLVHNTKYIDNYKFYKCTNFKDLIEIHGFHNNWSEI